MGASDWWNLCDLGISRWRRPRRLYNNEYGGWLKTGDQAIIDENGVLHILGRYKDLIIRGGENISPAKIEKCLEQIPGLFVRTSRAFPHNTRTNSVSGPSDRTSR
jgi:acyl-CoA synthetase (AMP-forming)/AMP-acid ligase II